MHRIGNLEDLNIDRVKRFLQRRLNALYINGLVAVGTFNAVLMRSFGDEICWGGELHVVVAGVDWNPLIDALSFRRYGYRNWWQDRPRANRVEDIGLAVDECLQRIPRETNELSWSRALKHPSLLSEYYRWSLQLPVGARLVRFGCNRIFGTIEKAPREKPIRFYRKRPYPYWLREWKFGNHEDDPRPPPEPRGDKVYEFYYRDGNAMKEAKARSGARHYSDIPDDELDKYLSDLGEDDRAKGKGGR